MENEKITDIANVSLQYWITRRDWRKITQNLRERKSPLPVELCYELAGLIDPYKLQPQGRPPLNKRLGEVAYATKQWPKNITKMTFIRIDSFYRSLIGYPKYGVVDTEQAKLTVCETFGISSRTYDKIYKQCKKHPHYELDRKLTAEIIQEQNSD